jgi:hypothetical protein
MFYETEEMIETFLGINEEDEEQEEKEYDDQEEDEEIKSFLSKINEHVCCKEEDMMDRGEDCLVYDFDGKVVHLIDTIETYSFNGDYIPPREVECCLKIPAFECFIDIINCLK